MLLFTDDCLGMLRNCMYIPNVRNGMKHPSLMSYKGVYKPSIRNIAVRKNNICSANGFNRRIRSSKSRIFVTGSKCPKGAIYLSIKYTTYTYGSIFDEENFQ